MTGSGAGQAREFESHKLTPVLPEHAERDAKKATFAYRQVIPESPSAPQPHPELAGRRLRLPADPAIYLVDPEGLRHWIPDPYTYNRLFKDWNGVFDDPALFDIADGGQLSHGATLIRADGTAPVCVVSNGTKRMVSPSVMDKCNFKWPANGDIVAPAVADAIPNGPPWLVA